MENFLLWCKHYEPLFLPILTAELACALIALYYARRADKWAEKEFNYDEEWNKKMLAREARRKANKVEPLEKEMD